ncbi:palmitoyltransferase ZDHHC1 isoform X2 [Pleurodeles waltl]|uniref:palmitoyltransferase ZDHHC1 isoform X2 n=1 Tax=Pleurodeles waltl TaxID=8319 RepID=UPI0037099110
MNICAKHHNKTAPEQDRQAASKEPPQTSRTNGWSWPPHPLQILAWITYIFFTVVCFGILIPLLPHHWVPAGYICTGVMFLFHLVVHLAAISIDPADDNVRGKNRPQRMPVFDRSKHAHVIENFHCCLCEVDVSPKSKHCSSCNKCVSNFDHHCKWLNNCVGGRNYWFFLNSIISAAISSLLVAIVASYVFMQYFLNPSMLRTDKNFQVLKNSTDVWFVFLPAAPVETQASAILVLAALVVLLGLLIVILLGHLFCFHVYLKWNRLSTYEYIMRQGHRQESKADEKEPDAVGSIPPRMVPFQNAGSLMFSNQDLQVKNSSSVTLRKELPNSHGSKAIKDDKQKGDYEPSLSFSPPQEEPQKSLQKRKKKKKKVFKVPEEVINDRSKDCNMDIIHSPSPESLPVASQGLLLPISAFPARSLPLLAQINHNPILAAGPPADYHSDSAESMDEIPVAQTCLGSAEVSSYSRKGHHYSKSSLGNSQKNMVPARQSRGEHSKNSPQQYSKRKSFLRSLDRQQMFELSPQMPSVFVSKSSAQLVNPNLSSKLSPREALSGHHKRKWPHASHNGPNGPTVVRSDYSDVDNHITMA